MKIKNLFDLMTDAQDFLTFFDKVESPEQLVSRLERLKRGPVRDFFITLEGLRVSVDKCFSDTIEPHGSLDDDEENEDEDEELANLERELTSTELTGEKDLPPEPSDKQESLQKDPVSKEQTSDSTPTT